MTRRCSRSKASTAGTGASSSPGGHLLAEGEAADRDGAEQAAEEEIFAIHPPSEHLIDEMLA